MRLNKYLDVDCILIVSMKYSMYSMKYLPYLGTGIVYRLYVIAYN